MTARRTRPQFDAPLLSVEICAGAGGQASGLHEAGFDHEALVEWDVHAVATLKMNITSWPGWTKEKIDSLEPGDVTKFLESAECKEIIANGTRIDLLAGGVPCPPFSLAGKQLGPDDERDLFPAMLEIVEKLRPRALMIENVRGILEPPSVFIAYRRKILETLDDLGYDVPKIRSTDSDQKQDLAMRRVWRRMDAKDFGVPQLRPRAILVAIHRDVKTRHNFTWPTRDELGGGTLLETLNESMLQRYGAFWDTRPVPNIDMTGQQAYERWVGKLGKAKERGVTVAPTLVGGSRKHGGADLGPTRAKRAWSLLGVDAKGVANEMVKCDPERDLFREDGPMLTVQQAALVQGFRNWTFSGGKTAQYRQVGNAFPPPVAEAVGRSIAAVLRPEQRTDLLQGYSFEGSAVSGTEGVRASGSLFAEADEESPRA
ncbi:DNA cytosine methyltransferase [Streptomyces sp. H34-S4]|uniref:DNA cytosine methyltransferase n=1 Tax=Streptomyces sp. H34-S4 TaxID=2996463 RepID=UPI00226F253D|nr:DNA (cytosine-5-)-methyltransferase [Streptomyces sp. H34-S4]MCY0934750.1 DNA (cytosine-5-)-methyltransferase [Streptomyces sp. H34-S4]